MPTLSANSLAKLDTCHSDIITVIKKSIVNGPDFTVLCGERSAAEQYELYQQGRTKPGKIVTNIDGVNNKSMHNHTPSLAIDIAPYPIDWADEDRFIYLGGYILGVADTLGIKFRWGGDWKQNGQTSDERFLDLPHFELISSI